MARYPRGSEPPKEPPSTAPADAAPPEPPKEPPASNPTSEAPAEPPKDPSSSEGPQEPTVVVESAASLQPFDAPQAPYDGGVSAQSMAATEVGNDAPQAPGPEASLTAP